MNCLLLKLDFFLTNCLNCGVDFTNLGLIHTRHFDGHYFDKNILPKKDIFDPLFLLAKVSSLRNMKYLDLWFVKSLPWLVIEIHGSKLSFYRNIFLFFYPNIVCQNVSCELGPTVANFSLNKMRRFFWQTAFGKWR